MLYFTLQIGFNPDVNSLLPEDNPSNTNFLDLNSNGEFTDNFSFLVRGDDLYTPEHLQQLYLAVEQIEAFDNITTGIHAFSFVTAEKRGSRIALTPISVDKEISQWTEEDARIFRERLLTDDIAENLIVSDDGDSLLFYFPAILTEDNGQQIEEIERILEPIESFASVYMNGGLFFTDRVQYYLQSDLKLLLSLSILIIMLIYFISFKAKRAVFLPMSVVLFATIWAMGIMSIFGFEMTIINIITPVLILTLGSSYSIHLLSDYYRTHPVRITNDNTWIAEVISHVAKTIVVEGMTTIAGFLSLLGTRIEAFREFGLSTSIGIVASVILTLFYLPAMLSIMSTPATTYYNMTVKGRLSLVIKQIAKAVANYWYVFLIIFALSAAGFAYSFPRVLFDTSFIKYYPKNEAAIVNLKEIVNDIGGVDAVNITIEAPEDANRYFIDTEVLKQVADFEEAVLEGTPEVTHILSFPQYIRFFNDISSGQSRIPDTPGVVMLLSRYFSLLSEYGMGSADMQALISDDYNSITISIRFTHIDKNKLTDLKLTNRIIGELHQYAQEYLPEETEVTIWGQVNRMLALNNLIERDQQQSTVISLFIVLLLAWITFSSFKYGVLALLPILFGIMSNYIFMYVFSIPFDMVTIAFSSVTVGVGIDDAIHYIIRFKSIYNHRPGNLKPAVKRTIELTGRPIILTTVAIIAGLLVLTMASFVPITYFGLLISIALLNTLLATLFILPSALIFWIGTERFFRKRLARKNGGPQA
jgi:hydrophobe/amphiphile efflux-3 (HAE3) family protein